MSARRVVEQVCIQGMWKTPGAMAFTATPFLTTPPQVSA
jgi:hypothetical protein